MLVGFCGEYARFQLMKCTFRPPPHNKQRYGDSWNYLVGQFVPALRDFFMKYFGDDRQDHNMFSDDSELLIAFNGRIFTVFGDGQVQENLYEFAAIGSCDAAMGAMHALSKSKQALSWDILDAGMQAAKEFSSNVGAPFETRVLFKAL
jgi:ATP-dependent protease HslVU (ClpYQ) peptidase subunit